ncbi:ClpXP protease specificity-enhancing factor [Alkalilimnicola sp. S0819]|uniref:ClpXP protease specificity-enhancing factor n=1 Tax=Alkalilimnicola sp. S0819 TaxID=2613922 RepID=UPI00126278C2|nr:ClpXP protease specificity-enhancing factor [Alkalilimnicola sp. S0819]KAB7623842.1 ClpXP protease specificity-enhancing factor [Alkalilimnicola sp. S0819]MPQ16718.1 ClpXP protease specificity-enhancing factor [Alkalilimnicola sp. S0819]
MTSSRPYLIRALYEWIVDNGLTPYLLVDASGEHDMDAPLDYADAGKLVLNIAPRAVRALNVSNEDVRFSARFGGVAQDVRVPVPAVMAIYARENGQGMMFADRGDGGSDPQGPGGGGEGPSGGGRPKLRVVK